MSKVSVIIATHSRPQTLPHAVESAQQAGHDVEVIVVDDASTDSTAEVCRSLRNIRYVRAERNQRVAGARNLGILVSTGDYITFLDDDDRRLPGSLDIQAAALDHRPDAGLVYGQALLEEQDGSLSSDPPIPVEFPTEDVFWPLLEWNFMSCLTVVFRRSCLHRIGILESRFARFDDWDLWIRIAELYPVIAIEEPVAVWRKATAGTGQGSSDLSEIFQAAARVYQERWLSLPRATEATREKRDQTRRNFCARAANVVMWEAAGAVDRGEFRKAIQKLSTATRLDARSIFHPYFVKLIVKNFLRPKHSNNRIEGTT